MSEGPSRIDETGQAESIDILRECYQEAEILMKRFGKEGWLAVPAPASVLALQDGVFEFTREMRGSSYVREVIIYFTIDSSPTIIHKLPSLNRESEPVAYPIEDLKEILEELKEACEDCLSENPKSQTVPDVSNLRVWFQRLLKFFSKT